MTPETYSRHRPALRASSARRVVEGREAIRDLPRWSRRGLIAYGGRWPVDASGSWRAREARLRLSYHARNVYLVLGEGDAGRVGPRHDETAKPVKTR